MVVVIVYFLKKRNVIVLSVKKPESPTVSFENPFYTVRDQANVTQVNTSPNGLSTRVILKYPKVSHRGTMTSCFYKVLHWTDWIITWEM